LLSGVNFRNGQTFGSLQHAPQFTHWPLRLSETGNIAVKVLFILASQVFFLSAISRIFQTIVSKQLLLQIYVNSATKSEANLIPHKNDASFKLFPACRLEHTISINLPYMYLQGHIAGHWDT